MQRLNVRVELELINIGQYRTLGELLERIRTTVGCVPPEEVSNLALRVCDDPDFGDFTMYLSYARPETDVEFDERAIAEAKLQAQHLLIAQGRADSDLQNRRDLYEMLKKEFGDE
jgi:hypothetical protein